MMSYLDQGTCFRNGSTAFDGVCRTLNQYCGWSRKPERNAQGRQRQQNPIPEWVNLDGAIRALAELLGPDARDELAELRTRDWFSEDHAVEKAQKNLAAKKSKGRPNAEIVKAREKVKEAQGDQHSRELPRSNRIAKLLPRTVFRAVDDADLKRDADALSLIGDRLQEWQALGYVPRREIARGAKTDEPIRTRGWTHWHHLFTPRQLLIHGLIRQGRQ